MFVGLRTALAPLIAVSALVTLPAKAGPHQSGAVNFPSDGVKELASPTGVTVYYRDPGPNADGVDERPILLRYPKGRTEQIDTFNRNADVSWSPHGDQLVITNHISSNVSDCTAITPANFGAHKQSMTSLISISRLGKVSKDMREGDHIYVSCGRWISPTRVEVKVAGYGCNSAPCTPRSFEHFFLYDFQSGRLTSNRSTSKRGT
jgi:hypothetical protein